jgi:hypothetical protein
MSCQKPVMKHQLLAKYIRPTGAECFFKKKWMRDPKGRSRHFRSLFTGFALPSTGRPKYVAGKQKDGSAGNSEASALRFLVCPWLLMMPLKMPVPKT